MEITIVKVDHYPIFNMLKIYNGCDIRKKSNGLNELINRANNEICISSMHLAYWKFHDTKKHKTSNKRYLTCCFLKELKEKGLLFSYKCILNLDK